MSQIVRRDGPGDHRRWSMLGVSAAAQATSALFVHAAPFLIPVLHTERGLGLATAGVLASMPIVGVMLTLIGWGALVDQIGERRVLVTGLALTALAGLGAALSGSYLAIGGFLLLGGMAAASTNTASGRVVVGWFPTNRRGLAMGIRQMAQPLGVGAAAISIPVLASAYGLGRALILPAVLAAVAALACAVVVKDPPRPARAHAADTGQLANPYRAGSRLWRIHGVSVLLVVPQFTVWTYALVWLIADRGWSPAAAGLLVASTQVLGALGRIAAGAWSDRAGSRMRPLRVVALAAAATMLALGLTSGLDSSLSVAILVVATVVTVADNGLAFTSVAEISGPYWSGRALGMQNTAQYIAAAAVPPVLGATIGLVGFPLAFALTAVCPVIAAPLVPVEGEAALT